jgi:hypothetical protein
VFMFFILYGFSSLVYTLLVFSFRL